MARGIDMGSTGMDGVARPRRLSPFTRRALTTGLLFQLPWLLGFAVFLLYPAAASFYYSFTHYSLFSAPRWIGLDNYRNLFSDQFFIQYDSLSHFLQSAVGNTLYMMVIGVPATTLFAFVVAMLLNAEVKGIALWRTLCFLPAVMSPLAASILWVWVFNPQFGIVNAFLSFLHLPQPGWLNDPAWSKPTLILLNLWQVGFSMIIYLAALQGVPKELYEAVAIDGGGFWARLRYITIPLVSPVTLFNVITGMIAALQFFTQAYTIGTASGNPQSSLLFYVTYIYTSAFQNFDMGYASAMSWLLFLMIAIFTAILLLASRRWTYYER
ncbi:MAG TPA: sugar ABC transporter permease [Chloroflexota bacterium]|nr:sugar ABC transporter permease [Chloroflexota bacterium]